MCHPQDIVHAVGIAKHAPARQQTGRFAAGTTLMLWVLDSADEYAGACREHADIVTTNRPLAMLAAGRAILAACTREDRGASMAAEGVPAIPGHGHSAAAAAGGRTQT